MDILIRNMDMPSMCCVCAASVPASSMMRNIICTIA